MNADLYIKNANIIDGSGQPSFKGSVAVKDGRIAEVFLAGNEPEEIFAAKTIDAEGYALTPGFIDIHCHTDETVFAFPECQSKILQGVTTDMAGNCGLSCAPVNPENLELLRGYVGEMPYNWRSFGEFLEKVEALKPAVNLACGVGHGSLRIAAMGFDPTPANKLQMDTMKRLLTESIDEGAWQLSSGLIYPPGVYADYSELAELCKVAAANGAYYSTHMRNEGLDIINALKEALDTAEKSGVSLEISHHKLARREVWGRSSETLAMIEAARAKGLDVWADQYPYDASSTYLSSNIPSWAFEGGVEALKKRAADPVLRKKILADMDESHKGRWQDISLGYAKTETYAPHMGRNMTEIGEIFGLTASEACLKIIEAEGNDAMEVNFGMCEEDIERIMQKDYVMIGSDGWAYNLDYPGVPHPRSFGAFPRVLSHFCRERKLFSPETAVRKMTGLPADRIGLKERGYIRKSCFADLVLLSLKDIKDDPDYASPVKPCSGIKAVWVNGTLAAEDGKTTGKRAGKVLKFRQD